MIRKVSSVNESQINFGTNKAGVLKRIGDAADKRAADAVFSIIVSTPVPRPLGLLDVASIAISLGKKALGGK